MQKIEIKNSPLVQTAGRYYDTNDVWCGHLKNRETRNTFVKQVGQASNHQPIGATCPARPRGGFAGPAKAATRAGRP